MNFKLKVIKTSISTNLATRFGYVLVNYIFIDINNSVGPHVLSQRQAVCMGVLSMFYYRISHTFKMVCLLKNIV